MSKELHIVRFAIKVCAPKLSISDINVLRLYKLRIEEANTSERKYGASDRYASDRREAFFSFQHDFQRMNGHAIVDWDTLEQVAEIYMRLSEMSTRDRDIFYLSCIADYMQAALSSDRANDIMYVPLQAIYIPFGEQLAGRDTSRLSRKTRLLERLADSSDHILMVRGLPGTGKSVVLRQVVRRLALRACENARHPIPILVPLGKMVGAESLRDADSVKVAVLRYLNNVVIDFQPALTVAYEYIASQMTSLLDSSRCIIIFDGMDELPRDGYDVTCRALLSFATKSAGRGNRFIFSCREFDYPKELRIHSLVLLPFVWRDVEHYLKNHLPQGEADRRISEAKALWGSGESSRAILNNPFFLHLACQHMLQNPREHLPANKGVLFDAYVTRVIRKDAGETADILRLLEELANWITDRKTSGIGVSWRTLKTDTSAAGIQSGLDWCKTKAAVQHFLEISSEGVSFRHHKLREFFAAKAIMRKCFQRIDENDGDDGAGPLGNDSYLYRVSGDIWYFETIALLASLLSGSDIEKLINCVLSRVHGRSVSPYRATLAAECLDIASPRPGNRLASRVSEWLTHCIRDDATGKVEKVECWQALGRLRFGGVQLGELKDLLDDDSRFVREEALKTVAHFAGDRVPGCQGPGFHLIKDALRIGAYDRLLSYAAWVFSRPLRSGLLTTSYVLSVVVAALMWLLPAPSAFILTAKYGPRFLDWWTAPSLVVAALVSIEIFFWLNEDKRLPHQWLRAPTSLRNVLSNDAVERQRARRVFVLALVPVFFLSLCLLFAVIARKQNEIAAYEQQASAHEEKSREYIAAAENVHAIPFRDKKVRDDYSFLQKPIPSYLTDAQISSVADTLNEEPTKCRAFLEWLGAGKDVVGYYADNADSSGRCRRLGVEIRRLGELVGSSGELSYRIKAQGLRDVAVTLYENGVDSRTDVSRQVVNTLRKEARRRGSDNVLVFGTYNQIGDKEAFEQLVSRAELEFISRSTWAAHSYLRILLANNFIKESALEKAEYMNQEAWFADVAGKLVDSVRMVAEQDGALIVPRSALTKGFDRVGDYIAKAPAVEADAVSNALEAFGEGKRIWEDEKRKAEEAFRLAEEAKKAAEQERAEARKRRLEQLGTACAALFIFWLAGWSFCKYVVPRMKIANLDVSSQDDIGELLGLAKDHLRDTAIRRMAIRKLALSDTGQAQKGLAAFVRLGNIPETLVTAAHKALYEQKRRQMRRGE